MLDDNSSMEGNKEDLSRNSIVHMEVLYKNGLVLYMLLEHCSIAQGGLKLSLKLLLFSSVHASVLYTYFRPSLLCSLRVRVAYSSNSKAKI